MIKIKITKRRLLPGFRGKKHAIQSWGNSLPQGRGVLLPSLETQHPPNSDLLSALPKRETSRASATSSSSVLTTIEFQRLYNSKAWDREV